MENISDGNRTPEPMNLDEDSNVETQTISLSQESSLLGDNSNDGITVVVPKPIHPISTDAAKGDPNQEGSQALDAGQGPNLAKEAPKAHVPGNKGGKAGGAQRGPKKAPILGKLVPHAQQSDANRRSRSRSKRREAKGYQGTNTPRQEADNRKRNRETGETPPSASHPSKKVVPLGIEDAKTRSTTDENLTQLIGVIDSTAPPGDNIIRPRSSNKALQNRLIGMATNAPDAQSAAKLVTPPTGEQQQPEVPVPMQTGTIPAPEGTSSSTIVQAPQETNKNVHTFADVAKEGALTLAIMDAYEGDHYAMLSADKFTRISMMINKIIISQLGKRIQPPRIVDSRLAGGVVRIKCADHKSRGWLETFMPKIPPKELWPRAKLTVMEFFRIPKPYKYNAWFPNTFNTPKEIFSLLEALNPGIVTNSWSVLSKDRKHNSGTTMVIGVGPESYDVITASGGKLFCGMSMATFSIVKRSIPTATISEEEATARADHGSSQSGQNGANSVRHNNNTDIQQ